MPARILGLAAILGGAARIAANFSQGFLSPHAAQTAYAIEDILLLLGLLGFALALRVKAGALGLTGIAVAAAGLLVIRAGALSGHDLYLIGAAASLFGTAILGAAILMRGADARAAGLLWLAALVVGLAALFPPLAMAASFAAALAFGAGFMLQGIVVWRNA
jgi:hypothetical protein